MRWWNLSVLKILLKFMRPYFFPKLIKNFATCSAIPVPTFSREKWKKNLGRLLWMFCRWAFFEELSVSFVIENYFSFLQSAVLSNLGSQCTIKDNEFEYCKDDIYVIRTANTMISGNTFWKGENDTSTNRIEVISSDSCGIESNTTSTDGGEYYIKIHSSDEKC